MSLSLLLRLSTRPDFRRRISQISLSPTSGTFPPARWPPGLASFGTVSLKPFRPEDHTPLGRSLKVSTPLSGRTSWANSNIQLLYIEPSGIMPSASAAALERICDGSALPKLTLRHPRLCMKIRVRHPYTRSQPLVPLLMECVCHYRLSTLRPSHETYSMVLAGAKSGLHMSMCTRVHNMVVLLAGPTRHAHI
ncbi:unnamed protein product [Protopolystoma xenopodis]|uniref:Uncharacterized protein n=1 Tax=Protopolystoma xenopodis TaxID=117903 RepID=A0A448WYV4_9PLAT|nr:unnamed protein product [Protopolystoma xenopodis]